MPASHLCSSKGDLGGQRCFLAGSVLVGSVGRRLGAASDRSRRGGTPSVTVVSLPAPRWRSGDGDAALSPSEDVFCAMIELAAEVRSKQAESRVRGDGDAALSPSEDIFCAMIELAARDAPADAWDALEERSARSSVGQERIEVLEARALTALRRGRRADAAAQLAKARALAERIPNVMGPRLQRWIAEAERQPD